MEQFEKLELKLKWFQGYLSADPVINYFEKGSIKTTFSIPLKDGESTVWLNCIAWNKLAEKIAEDCKKGTQITVGGIFEQREYNGKTYTDFNVKVIG